MVCLPRYAPIVRSMKAVLLKQPAVVSFIFLLKTEGNPSNRSEYPHKCGTNNEKYEHIKKYLVYIFILQIH